MTVRLSIRFGAWPPPRTREARTCGSPVCSSSSAISARSGITAASTRSRMGSNSSSGVPGVTSRLPASASTANSSARLPVRRVRTRAPSVRPVASCQVMATPCESRSPTIVSSACDSSSPPPMANTARPSVSWSPAARSCQPTTSAPLTCVPLWLPRSRTRARPPPYSSSAWRRETEDSESTTLQSAPRPSTCRPSASSKRTSWSPTRPARISL